MFENESRARAEKPPVLNLIVILLMVGLGFVIVGPLVGVLVALPFYNGSLMDLTEAIQPPLENPEIKVPLYIIQGCSTLFGLIIAPALYLQREKKTLRDFFTKPGFNWFPIVVTVFVMIIFMAVNSVFVEWNAEFNFPDFAQGFENWARSREDSAAELTKFLTDFGSRGELLLAFFVIAVLPAIGEELVFRGLIQQELYRGTKNIHVAIWVSAVLFSAIHFQFFGFVPRLLLGALFGYLYYWSGNLSLAILAHFVNNGVSVLALYLYQQGTFDFDIESSESLPAPVVILSGVITAGLLYGFYKYYKDRHIALD
jgi:membrane protease YdiL (CAAX protease family)